MGSQPTSWLLGRRSVCLSVSFYGSLSAHFQPLTPSQPHTSSGESIYGVCFVDTSIGNFHVRTSHSPPPPLLPSSSYFLIASPFLTLPSLSCSPFPIPPLPLHTYLGTHPKPPAFFLSPSSLPPFSLSFTTHTPISPFPSPSSLPFSSPLRILTCCLFLFNQLGQFSDDRQCSRLRTLIAHYPPAQVHLTIRQSWNRLFNLFV